MLTCKKDGRRKPQDLLTNCLFRLGASRWQDASTDHQTRLLPCHNAYQVKDDVCGAHGWCGLQCTVGAQQHDVLEALLSEEALGDVVVASYNPAAPERIT